MFILKEKLQKYLCFLKLQDQNFFVNFVSDVVRACQNTFEVLLYPRTATDMDGTLHTDICKSETSRNIKKSFEHHLNIFKSCIIFQN